MILISIYGKTEPTIISEKLGVGICNPQYDWVESFPNDFDEEYMVQMHHTKNYKLSNLDDFSEKMKKRYDYDKIVEKLNWNEDGKDSKIIIAEHLVEIQVLDFKHSLLKKSIQSLTVQPVKCSM